MVSFSSDITLANQAKLKCYPNNIQSTILAKFKRIADPAGDDGFLFTNDIKKANDYIESLPHSVHDIPDWELQDIAKRTVDVRKCCKDKSIFTPRQIDYPYVLRRLRRQHRRQREQEMLMFNQVHLYASWRAERDSRQQADRATEILSKRFLETKHGFIPMNEIAQTGAEHRTWETLHKLSALAEIMTENNWQASFSVVTLPSRLHTKSKKWNGSMPDESHAWANSKWRNVRATLSQKGYEEGVDWMAVRTTEAHKDGAPHYNYVTIGDINFLNDFNTILEEKFLLAADADGNEDGAAERRIKSDIESGAIACKKIISYATKYSLKTYLPENLHRTTEHAKEHVRSVAWRQTWGIRAFSFCGFAPVTLWRECRAKHYSKADIDLVRYAVETNWVEFQKEFISIGRKNIKPVHTMVFNKYMEETKKCIGHFIKGTTVVIAERINRAVIRSKRELDNLGNITVIRSEPSKSKSNSKPVPEPPDHTLATT